MLHDALEVGLKLGLAVVLAGAVGIERERKGRAAGLRTHVLVCLGSTLAMVIAQALGRTYGHDQGRMAAGIITGVGFLGAGTIINVRGAQRGLTTAAMIWFVAALGIAIGLGYLLYAVMATAFALSIVLLFTWVELLLPSTQRFSVTVRMMGGLDKANEVECFMRDQGLRVTASRLRRTTGGDAEKIDITLEVVSKTGAELDQIARGLTERFTTAKIIFER